MLALTSVLLFQQLVANGSFEELSGANPARWRSQSWDGRVVVSSSPVAKTGQRSLMLESTDGADAGVQLRLEVPTFTLVRISAWVKTEGVERLTGQGAGLNIHSRPEHSPMITGTHDWQQVTFDVETGDDDTLLLNCIMGYYGLAKGKVWFDDITIQPLRTTPLKQPRITFATRKTFDPIPKYIYSQFIEHLGRCIYGGIWAELLEDRKFYYAVGDRNSPWKGSATMDKKDRYTNTQSAVTSDISTTIAVEKGRALTGYAVLKGAKGQVVTIGVNGRAHVVGLKGTGWERFPFTIVPNATTEKGTFSLKSSSKFKLGTASLMPADNIKGMRRDTLALLKRLDAPLYRWPGGNFVSGYDWRDGIGDRDKRPVRKNPAWQGIDSNDFGTHEFMVFCQELNTEPLIVVNTGFGDAHSAAQWLEYMNKPATTEGGRLRALNGVKQPWGVHWWGIGNEMFGNWQLGYMAQEQYITKHGMFFDRMKEVDPTIQVIGVGETGGNWSRNMLAQCADQMDLLSEHFYCQERPGVASHAALIPNAIRAKVSYHRELRKTLPNLKGKDVKIAMDEWNYWYGPHVFGELGTRYFMKDALGIAEGLHEYYRSTDIVGMAQYAQTVNVIGAIKTSATQAAMETTGLVLELYRREFGVIPFDVQKEGPVDAMGAWTADRKAITVGLVNPTGVEQTVPLVWGTQKVATTGKRWTIADPDPMAYNDPTAGSKIGIKESTIDDTGKISLAPYSVTVIRVPVR